MTLTELHPSFKLIQRLKYYTGGLRSRPQHGFQPISEASSACSFANSFLLIILTPPLRVVRMRFC